MTLKVSWEQALAWRMHRQLLDPIGHLSVPEVVRRLCGVQAQVASSAELAVRVRRQSSHPDEINRALSEGRLLKTWAMRGTLHLLTPEEGGAFLSLLAAGRSWERPSWVRWFGVGPKEMEVLRAAVRQALDGTVLTREELVAAVTTRPGLGHVSDQLRSGWGTPLKPLAWQGDLCFGPMRGSRVTFMRPDQASTRWAGVPDPDDAAPTVIAAYLSAFGPATIENFRSFMARGRISARQLRAWFAAVGDRLAEIAVDGDPALLLAEDQDELAATKASAGVRLLPGFDQYVMGPGTEDGHVVPAARRSAVSRQSGWIAPVVVLGGVVHGTWELDGDIARIAWFREQGTPRATHWKRRSLGSQPSSIALSGRRSARSSAPAVDPQSAALCAATISNGPSMLWSSPACHCSLANLGAVRHKRPTKTPDQPRMGVRWTVGDSSVTPLVAGASNRRRYSGPLAPPSSSSPPRQQSLLEDRGDLDDRAPLGP